MKKAQSISINTIIVAAIALIVLIVVILIFTGNLRGFRENTSLCQNNGGTCVGSTTDCQGEYKQRMSQYDYIDEKNTGGCTDQLKYCCLTLVN
jgi:hypothetical protein